MCRRFHPVGREAGYDSTLRVNRSFEKNIVCVFVFMDGVCVCVCVLVCICGGQRLVLSVSSVAFHLCFLRGYLTGPEAHSVG